MCKKQEGTLICMHIALAEWKAKSDMRGEGKKEEEQNWEVVLIFLQFLFCSFK